MKLRYNMEAAEQKLFSHGSWITRYPLAKFGAIWEEGLSLIRQNKVFKKGWTWQMEEIYLYRDTREILCLSRVIYIY